jgi:hypothetical protein
MHAPSAIHRFLKLPACLLLLLASTAATTLLPSRLSSPQGAKIFGDGVWFKTNASALTPEGANILGFGFGLGNNLPALFVSTVSAAAAAGCHVLAVMCCVWRQMKVACLPVAVAVLL